MKTQRKGKRQMTRAELLALPPVVELWPTAAEVLGIGRSAAYELARSGQWPTRLLRLGHRYRVPTAELLALVGVDHSSDTAA